MYPDQLPTPPPVFVPVSVPPTWLQIATPAATVLAAVIALIAVVVTMRQRRADLVRAEQREIARARAHARLVRLGGRPVWEPIPDDPDGRYAWGIKLTNLDDRTILAVRPEFWMRSGDGPHGDPNEPFTLQPEILRAEQSQTYYLAFEPTEEGYGPGMKAWRIRWSDVDGYDWCFDRYDQEEPARYTGQPPTPYLD